MQFLRLRCRVRGEALRRVFQASRNGVARGVPREYPNRHRGGAVQEHAPLVLPERQQPAAQAGRHRGGRGIARTRHRRRFAHGRPGSTPDAPHGIQPLQRRVQESLPQGQALRHRARAVLRIVDVELLERHDGCRPCTGDFAQSPETGRTVLEAQMLHDVRIRHLCRRPQGVPAPA